ncbi:hypothetical protein BGX28_002089 [Mortierella sp. GBA30]|nr:hypothetical protein BGX28_002089 [Mortierella sp. GBA30]
MNAPNQVSTGAAFVPENSRATVRNVMGMANQMTPNAMTGSEGSLVGVQGSIQAQQLQPYQLHQLQLQQQQMQHLQLQQLQQQQAHQAQPPSQQQISSYLQQQPQQVLQQQQQLQQTQILAQAQMSPSLQNTQQMQQQQQRAHIQQHLHMQAQQQQQQQPNPMQSSPQSQPQAQLMPSQQQQMQLSTQALSSAASHTVSLLSPSQHLPVLNQQTQPSPLQMQHPPQRQIPQQQHLHHQLQLNHKSPELQMLQVPQSQEILQSGHTAGPISTHSAQDLTLAEEWNARALLKLTEFGRELGLNAANITIQFWQSFVAKFYGNAGRMRYKLVNPATNESKVFDLVAAALPRLYLKNAEAGVKGVQLMLEQTLGQTGTLPLTVECPNVSMVSHFLDGSRVFMKGAIKATFASDFKFDVLELTSMDFSVYIPRPVDDSASSPLLDVKVEGKKKGSKKIAPSKKIVSNVPENVVNEFGITSKTMQQLEMSNTISEMSELMQYSTHTKRGATESLAAYSQLLRERQALLGNRQMSQFQSLSAAHIFTTPMAPQTLDHTVGQTVILANNGSTSIQAQTRASASPRSIKRRTSKCISPSESSLVASPAASPAMDESVTVQTHATRNIAHAGTPTIHHPMISNTSISTESNHSVGHLGGLRMSQTGVPSIASPVFMPNTVPVPSAALPAPTVKGSKRVRRASVTPTLAATMAATASATTNGTKTPHANGTINGPILSPGRNRKGTSRKELTSKRKTSMSEEHSGLENPTLHSAAGPLESNQSGAVGSLHAATSASPMLSTGSDLGPRTPGASTGLILHGPLPHHSPMAMQAVVARAPNIITNSNGMHVVANGVSAPPVNSINKDVGGIILSGATPQAQSVELTGQSSVYQLMQDPASLSNGQGFMNVVGQPQSQGQGQIYGHAPGIGLGLGLGMQSPLQQYQQQHQPQLQQQQLQFRQQLLRQHQNTGHPGAVIMSSMDGLTAPPQNTTLMTNTNANMGLDRAGG